MTVKEWLEKFPAGVIGYEFITDIEIKITKKFPDDYPLSKSIISYKYSDYDGEYEKEKT